METNYDETSRVCLLIEGLRSLGKRDDDYDTTLVQTHKYVPTDTTLHKFTTISLQ
ncbi:hypothetical protein WUBG_06359 [Wuchereria bancrofti]|uniref:Uncharacterized protein n=1 Tax=Wuchereria bancrofti TaxID=6293 RepID=J9EJU9_WUCBA|nr:hypothetical protein WUBG_06359 [Wuchereria bancrofti]